jgi:hypothetical protein
LLKNMISKNNVKLPISIFLVCCIVLMQFSAFFSATAIPKANAQVSTLLPSKIFGGAASKAAMVTSVPSVITLDIPRETEKWYTALMRE